MGEIQLTRIRSIYGDIKGLISQIPPLAERNLVNEFIVVQFNKLIDNLSEVSGSDYSTYKVPESQRNHDWPSEYQAETVRVQLGRAISRLEEEYGLNKTNNNQTPTIVIFNKNENEISLNINYTIIDLIEICPDKECKSKLKQLENELEKPNKNWDLIKGILIWILNFSKELFLKVIPIILQKKL